MKNINLFIVGYLVSFLVAQAFADASQSTAVTPTARAIKAEQLGMWHIVSRQVSNTGGVQGALTIGTSPIEVKVGSSSLVNRIHVTALNNSNTTIYWGYTSSVTTSTGTPIYATESMAWNIGPNTKVFIIAANGSNNVRVTESAY